MQKQEKISSEIALLIEIGHEVGEKAKEENFSLGLPVYYWEEGQLIELHSSGEKKIVNKETNGRSK